MPCGLTLTEMTELLGVGTILNSTDTILYRSWKSLEKKRNRRRRVSAVYGPNFSGVGERLPRSGKRVQEGLRRNAGVPNPAFCCRFGFAVTGTGDLGSDSIGSVMRGT